MDTVKKIVEASGEIGLKYLTLYTFSIENWNRPKAEVDALMGLMVDAIVRETADLMRQNVRVMAIGNLKDLPEIVMGKLNGLISQTANNTGVTLVLGIKLWGRWEIREAARRIAEDYKSGILQDVESLDDEKFATYLTTKDIPDPDLLIRTQRRMPV